MPVVLPKILKGTSAADILTINNTKTIALGLGEADQITINKPNALIVAGNGGDQVTLLSHSAKIFTGKGADTITVDASIGGGLNYVDGGADHDVLVIKVSYEMSINPDFLNAIAAFDNFANKNAIFNFNTHFSSLNYRVKGIEDVQVVVTNPPPVQPHFVVTPVIPAPTLNVNEGGQISFTVKLDIAPTNPFDATLTLTDPATGSLSTVTLHFDSNNYDSPQTVTFTANHDDDVMDTTSLSVVISGGNAEPKNVPLTIHDDDEAAVVVTHENTTLATDESGATDTFSVVLSAKPSSDVTINIVSNDTSEATVSHSQLIFTTLNWNVAQEVTVTGQSDNDADSDTPFTIITDATESADPLFDNLDVADVNGVNASNDDVISGGADNIVTNASSIIIPKSALLANDSGTGLEISGAENTDPFSPITVTVESNSLTVSNISQAGAFQYALSNELSAPQQVNMTVKLDTLGELAGENTSLSSILIPKADQDNTIITGAGNDIVILTSGNGTQTVTDFSTDFDKINIANFNDLIGPLGNDPEVLFNTLIIDGRDSSDNAEIILNNTTLVLSGHTLGDLSADDFMFF